MPFDSDGKWTPPGGKWAFQQHQEDVQQAEQMSPDEIARRQAGNQMDTEPLPTPPDDGSDNNPSNLPEGVSSEFAANHPDLTNFLTTATSPIRNFLNNTSIGQGIQRFGQGADQLMFPGAVGSPTASTGNDYVDKAIDFASMIPGTLINPGGAATGLGTAMNQASEIADMGINALTKDIQPTTRLGQIGMDLGKGFVKDTAAGVPFAINDQFNNQSDESIGSRLGDVGLESLGFGAFGLGLRGAGKAIEATGLPSKIMDFLGRNRTEESPLEEPKITEDTPTQEQNTEPTTNPTEEPKINEESPIQTENNDAAPALSPKEQEFLDLLGKNGRSLDDVESTLQKANDNHLNTELSYLAESGGKGVEQGQLFRDENGDVIGRQGRQSNNPQWYQDFYADKGRAPSPNELVDLAYKRLREGSPEAPAHQEFLNNEQLLNFIQGLKEKVEKPNVNGQRSYNPSNPMEEILHQGNLISTKRIRNMPFYRGEMTSHDAELGKELNIARPQSLDEVIGGTTQKNIQKLEGFVKQHQQELEQSQKELQAIRERESKGFNYEDQQKKPILRTKMEQAKINIEGRLKQIDELKQSLRDEEEMAQLSKNDLLYLTSQRHTAENYANQREGFDPILFGDKPANYKPTIHEMVGNFDHVLDLSKIEHGKLDVHTLVQLLEELGIPKEKWDDIISRTKIDEMSGRKGNVFELFRGKNLPEIMNAIKDKGYDGIRYQEGNEDNWIALDRNKIKPKNEVAATSEVKSSLSDAVKNKFVKEEQPQEGTKGFFGNSNLLSGLKKSEETIARNQVVNNLRKNLGLNIDTGRLPVRGAQGVYKVSPEVIRTARSEDISVIAHEIGHHLEKRLNLVDPAYQTELEKIAAPLVQGNKAYTPADHAEEGLAEFFRRYLTEDHAQLKQDAPKLYDYIQNSLAGQKLEVKGKKFDVTKGLSQAREDIQKWINQGEYNQAVGKLDFAGKDEKQPGSWKRFYSQFVDDLNPLKLFEKDLNGKVGLGKDSIYKLARNSRGIAEQAKVSMERGIYLNGQKIGDGLAEIVKPLEKLGVDQKDFATYLAVKQSHDLQMNHGKNVAFTDGEMKAVMDRFDGTPVEQVQKGVVQWNQNMMKVLEDAQIIKPGTADHLAQTYPNYTPLMRYFDDDAIAGFKDGGFGAAKGFANLSNPVKRMTEEGSQRTIINPLESMVKNSFLVFNAAAKNKVGLRLAEMSKIDGAGAWVEHLGEGGRDGKEHIITVFQDGKGNQYKVRDPELYSAMLSLDHESSNSVIRFLGSMASVLRSGATLTPEFMARNAIRDLTEAFINTGMNPLLFVKGFFHVIRKDDMFDKFLTTGGGQSVLMSLDRNYNREALKKIFHESIKDKTMNVVTSPKELAKLFVGYTPAKLLVKGLRHGAEISELSTRLGQFERILKKTGDIDEAAYQARDLMDFNKAGSNIRQANRAVAFMNAGIQGVDKMARSFWGNGFQDGMSKASYLTRVGASLVLPAVGLYQLKQHLIENDPEWKRLYENVPQWEKDSFFIIPMPGHWFARVPKPFEAGMLYSTGTERILDYMHGQDPKVKDYIKSLAGAFSPNTLPTMLMPLLEGITNYNFFQGRSIIPTSEQKLQKQDQYGINTTETAKLLGKGASNVPILNDTNFSSPRIIDNTIRGYTAGLGGYAVSGIDAVLNKLGIAKSVPQPAKDLKDAPLLRAFTVSTSGGGQIRQDFYDKFDQLSQEHNSDKKNQAPLTGQDAKDYARMNDVKRGIDKLVKVYKQAQADPKLDPQQKRQILDGLDQRMDQLSKIGLNRK